MRLGLKSGLLLVILALVGASAALLAIVLIVAPEGKHSGLVTLAWAIALGVLVLGAFSFYYFCSSILRRLRAAEDQMARLSEYDLRQDVRGEGIDELAELGDLTERLTNEWRKMIYEILDISASVSNSTSHVWSSLSGNFKAIGEQQRLLEQMSASGQQMARTSVDIAMNAATAVEISQNTTKVANESTEQMNLANQKIIDLATTTEKLSFTINDLKGRADEIGGIVSLINDIADQTNLLALNAAIEAARAGDQGRGFAVVADEVRKLAEKTLRATSEISGKVKGIQADSTETAEKMGIAAGELAEAISFIHSTKTAIDKIASEAKRSESEITNIAASIEEQSSSTEEISQIMEDGSRVTTKVTDDIREMFKDMDALSGMVTKLVNGVRKFKLPVDSVFELEAAKVGHKTLLQLMYRMYYSGKEFDMSKYTDYKGCKLGQWYYGGAQKSFGSQDSFRLIEEPHRMLHDLTVKAVEAYKRGEKSACLDLIEQMTAVSNTMMKHIDDLKGTINSAGGGRGQ